MFDLEKDSKKTEVALTSVGQKKLVYQYYTTSYSSPQELLDSIVEKALELNRVYYIEIRPDITIFKYWEGLE